MAIDCRYRPSTIHRMRKRPSAEELGARIATLREDRKLSQTALAKGSGIRQPSLWKIEHGETKVVAVPTLFGLAEALGTTVEHLWFGAEDDSQSESELVAIYRKLPKNSRNALLQSAKTLAIAAESETQETVEAVPAELPAANPVAPSPNPRGLVDQQEVADRHSRKRSPGKKSA